MASEASSTFLRLQSAVAGRYALERELGRGGMGVVYLARDLSLDRPVAIKLLPPALAEVPELRERFLREARTAARLSHPNIVPVHSVEEHGEFVLFVMGYVEGETLGQRIARQGPLSPEDAGRILQEVAWALAYAHQHGVIHRDVKPDNILLDRATGRALITDFGIARVADAVSQASDGIVVGTVRYMSPEQIAGGPLDGRSDLFSLGATGYLALTGRPPFENSVAASVIASGTDIVPVAAQRPELPTRLAVIIDRCLALDPAQRFPDGEALAEALDAARSRQVAVPLPVERFADFYKTFATEIASYAALVEVLALQLILVRNQPIQGLIFAVLLAWGFFGAVGLGLLRYLQVLRAARTLQQEGYSVADVRRALTPREEPGKPRWHPALRAAAWIAGSALWVVLFRSQMTVTLGAVLDGLVMALLTIGPVVALRSVFARMLRPRGTGWWSRFWWKVVDWKVFKVARGGKAPAIPASEPTELALGAGTRELFAQLPAELRRQLEGIPALVERLETQAGRLRRSADPDGRERLASTFAALENLRLDLLRLRASSQGDLTADLDAARRVTERIDALVQANRELDTPTPV